MNSKQRLSECRATAVAARRSSLSTDLLVRAGTALLGTVLLLALLGLTACQPAQTFNGEVVQPAEAVPELVGVNWDGQPFRLSQHRGKVVILFFGYTFCPDICPFTLAKLKQLEGRLGERAEDVEVVFVSVDPQRDTLEKLSRYVPNFDKSFYGVRLELPEVDLVSEDFGLTVQYGLPKDGVETESFYYVDHTGTYFIIDREGRLRLTFPPNAKMEEMLPDVEALLAG